MKIDSLLLEDKFRFAYRRAPLDRFSLVSTAQPSRLALVDARSVRRSPTVPTLRHPQELGNDADERMSMEPV